MFPRGHYRNGARPATQPSTDDEESWTTYEELLSNKQQETPALIISDDEQEEAAAAERVVRQPKRRRVRSEVSAKEREGLIYRNAHFKRAMLRVNNAHLGIFEEPKTYEFTPTDAPFICIAVDRQDPGAPPTDTWCGVMFETIAELRAHRHAAHCRLTTKNQMCPDLNCTYYGYKAQLEMHKFYYHKIRTGFQCPDPACTLEADEMMPEQLEYAEYHQHQTPMRLDVHETSGGLNRHVSAHRRGNTEHASGYVLPGDEL